MVHSQIFGMTNFLITLNFVQINFQTKICQEKSKILVLIFTENFGLDVVKLRILYLMHFCKFGKKVYRTVYSKAL